MTIRSSSRTFHGTSLHLSSHARLLVMALLLSVAPAQTTGSWQRQSPLPTASELRAVDGAPGGAIWAVGQNGVVADSTNSGASWNVRYLQSGIELWDVSFADSQNGWIAGDQNFRTTNGGATWQSIGSTFFVDISFGDASHGLASDGVNLVYRSNNGGLFWSTSTPPGVTRLQDVVLVDATNGWAVGKAGSNGAIYRTTDGGASWLRQGPTNTGEFHVVAAVDAQNVWAATGPQIWRSSNGGASWQMTAPPRAALSLDFRSATMGLAVASGGMLLRTVDGGATWQLVAGATASDPLRDAAWTGATSACAVGLFGFITTTQDAGQTWQQSSQGFGDIVTDIDAVDDLHAFACTSQLRQILATADGGTTWTSRPLPFSVFQESPESLDFVDRRNGWLVSTSPSQIGHTTDGGATWTQQHATSSQLFEVLAFDAQTVVVGGAWDSAANATPAARTLRTTNGGQSWVDITPQFFGLNNTLWYGSFKLTENLGWLAGQIVVSTSNGGASWAQVLGRDPNSRVYHDVCFADESHGWVVGEAGLIRATVDGGANWTSQNAGVGTVTLTGVSAINHRTAWVSTADGRTLRTLNGGASWQLDSTSESTGGFYAIAMRSEDRGWVVGHPLSGLSNPGGNIYQRRPGTPLDLTMSNFRGGHTTDITVHGVSLGELAFCLFSPNPNPTGSCSVAAGMCIDLIQPFFLLGVAVAGANGSASLPLAVPTGLRPAEVRIQSAIVRTGVVLTSNAVTRPLVTQ